MKRRDDLQQSTGAWLDWRKTKITASEAPIIMGESPWCTPFQLWEQKLGLREPQQVTDSMQRGKDLEETIVKMCATYLCVDIAPAVIECEIPGYEWMGASVDGISDSGKTLIEVKCASRNDHESAKKGIVPQKYVGQLNHMLFVTELPEVVYASYHDDEVIYVHYKRNETYIREMLEQEKLFWTCLQEFSPPPLTDKDYVENNSDEWLQAACSYQEVTRHIKELEGRQIQLRNELISLANDRSTKGSGLRLTRFMKRGQVRYSAIPELATVNLEQYRSKPSVQWRFS